MLIINVIFKCFKSIRFTINCNKITEENCYFSFKSTISSKLELGSITWQYSSDRTKM